jgi:hypothetical protein
MIINYIGQSDSLAELFEMLGKYTLDPTFEKYGNFYMKHDQIEVKDCTHRIWGNFFDYSFVFSIDGTKEELEPLRKAIRAHQKGEKYLSAKEDCKVPSWLFPERALPNEMTVQGGI